IGRPSFISSGSETTLPSSRTRLTAGTAYIRIDLVRTLAAGVVSGTASSAALARPPGTASAKRMTPVSATGRNGRGRNGGVMVVPWLNGSSRHDPVPFGDQGGAARVAEMHDVTAFGCESLIGGQRQARVIAGDDPVLEQRLQLLDQVRPREV